MDFNIRKWEAIVLILIIVIGAGFRFYRLDEKGYIFPDERYYNYSARNLLEAVKGLNAKMNIPSAQRREKVEEIVGIVALINQFYAKPTHSILSAAGLFLFAGRSYGDLYLFALLGAITIVLLYFLARSISGIPAALLASAYMAFSPLHISYSRSALAQTAEVFFLVLALVFYVRSLDFTDKRPLYLCLSGLLLGLAFTSHYAVGVFFVVLVMYELGLLLKKISSPRQMGILIVAMLLPLFFFELLYVVGKIYTGDKVLGYSNSYFLASILQFLAATAHGGFHLSDPSNGWIFPIRFWAISEGYFSLAFILAGALYLILNAKKEKAKTHTLLLISLFLPYIFWALVSSHGLVARAYSPLIPVVAIIVAVGLVNLVDLFRAMGLKRRLSVVLSLALAILLFGNLLFNSKKCIAINSPYVAIEEYLKKNDVQAVGTIGEWFFFRGIENIRAKTWPEVLELHEKGKFRYFINDHMSMRPEALEGFLSVNKGVVLSEPNAFNYIPYQYEGIPRQIRLIWNEHLPLQTQLIDLRKYKKETR
ncbi:MAG: glycosyltransferase family 39 protein [Candidatus Omnitrophica bacterium]|nr:glycosyltransferase family 39 protein [Candidatus Omnitrophota bacterium]